MKRIIAFLLIGVAVGLFSCTQETKVYRIGAIVPLSGDAEAYGQVVKSGLMLALEDINAAGGVKGKPLDILFEDDGSDPEKGAQKANSLISGTQVPLIIGGVTSSEALKIASACEAGKTILFSPTASSPKLSGISQFFFRNYPSDTLEGAVMAEYAVRKLKVSKVAVLYLDKEYGQGLTAVFKGRFQELGGTITYEKGYPEGTVDFSPFIKEMKASAPDSIYLPGYYTEIANVLKAIAAEKLPVKILSSGGMASPRIMDMAGDALEGVVFPQAAYDAKSSDPGVQRFVAAYKKKFYSEPDVYAAYAYDSLRVVAQAIDSCVQYPQDLRSRLADVSYKGITGDIEFNDKGDVAITPRMFQVKGGEFVPAD